MNILFIFVKTQVAFGSYLGWRLPSFSHEFTRDLTPSGGYLFAIFRTNACLPIASVLE